MRVLLVRQAPPHPHPRHHYAADRRLGHPARPQPGHGHPRLRNEDHIPHPRPRRRYPASFDSVLADQGVEAVKTGVKMPRMNAIMERWIRSCRAELLDRTLIWDQAHLMHALREYEQFHNEHRPHRALSGAAPLRPLPEPVLLQNPFRSRIHTDRGAWASNRDPDRMTTV